MPDIRTTEAYKEFSVKRKEWVRALRGKDRNSILHQIGRMLWDAAAYRIVNEARALAPPAAEGGIQLNGVVHRLIDDGFSTSQFVAVRRILDPEASGPTGKRGVFSLLWLLRDMHKHARLITRVHVFAAERIQYDVEAVRRRRLRYAAAERLAGAKAYAVPRELSIVLAERRHASFDDLAGVEPSARRRSDAVRPDVFDGLSADLDHAGKKIGVIVNKLIAHAATPASRRIGSALRLKATLGELWDAHRAICQVANFVGVHLLGGPNYGGLAVPQWDQFQYIDRALVSGDQIQHLREAWARYDRETHEWANWKPAPSGTNRLPATIGNIPAGPYVSGPRPSS